jgi:hypothetical protein
VAGHASRRPLGRFVSLERSNRQCVVADDAILLLIDDDVRPGRAGAARTGSGTGCVLDQPDVQGGDTTAEAPTRVLVLKRPRTVQPLHGGLCSGATREAGAIGEQALGAITPAGNQELRQRLATSFGGAIEELSVSVLDAKAEAPAFDSRGFLGGASHTIGVHTLYVIGQARGFNRHPRT